MKRWVLFGIVAMAVFAGCTGPQAGGGKPATIRRSVKQAPAETDLTRQHMKGRVKSTRDEGALLVNKYGKRVETGRFLSATADYDRDGNETESITYNPDGSIDTKKITSYDGKRHTKEWIMYNSEGVIEVRHTYRYDLNGNEVEHVMFNEDGSQFLRYVKVYDRTNNMVKSTYYLGGSISSVETNNYDPSGRNVEEIHKDYGPPVTTRRVVHEYDSATGRKTQSLYGRVGGAANTRVMYAYNTEGMVSKETRYNAKGACIGSTAYTYDADGVKIGAVEYRSDGRIKQSDTYDGNIDGPIETVSYNPDGSIEKKEGADIKYDAAGNWISMTSLKWVTKFGKSYMEPTMAVHRTITYY